MSVFPYRRAALATCVPLLLAALVTGCDPAQGDDGARRPAVASEPAASSEAGVRTGALPARGTAWVIFGADTVVAEVARTPDQRASGLMYREEVPDGTGMLFVFEDTAIRSFWMRNTYVPLDIAYMDPSFRIVDIQAMEPETEELYESAAPAMFALEVRQGWFEERGIEVGRVAEVVFGG